MTAQFTICNNVVSLFLDNRKDSEQITPSTGFSLSKQHYLFQQILNKGALMVRAATSCILNIVRRVIVGIPGITTVWLQPFWRRTIGVISAVGDVFILPVSLRTVRLAVTLSIQSPPLPIFSESIHAWPEKLTNQTFLQLVTYVYCL